MMIYILSDLHMAEGDQGYSTYKGTENFFSDDALEELILYLLKIHTDNPGEIIVNGDFVDFIRTTSIPESKEDFNWWQSELDRLQYPFQLSSYQFSRKEKRYGLGTNDFKSIWKLMQVIKGHEKVFKALALWVLKGNKLKVGAGNHDPEWYWDLCQKYLIMRLLDFAQQIDKTAHESFASRISFYIKGFPINEEVWIEHGHMREYMTAICPEYELEKCKMKLSFLKSKEELPSWKKQLAIPFGSFWNRYLVNRVELSFPFINNMKSTGSIAKVLFKEYPYDTIRLFFSYALYALFTIPKVYRKFLLRSAVFVLLNLVPFALLAWVIYNWIQNGHGIIHLESKWLAHFLNGFLGLVIPFILRLILHYCFKKAGLVKRSLDKISEEDILSESKYDVVLMGHNHYPQHIIYQINGREKHYINTGTWTNLFSLDIRDVRTVPELTVAKIDPDRSDPRLLIWDHADKKLVPFKSVNNI